MKKQLFFIATSVFWVMVYPVSAFSVFDSYSNFLQTKIFSPTPANVTGTKEVSTPNTGDSQVIIDVLGKYAPSDQSKSVTVGEVLNRVFPDPKSVTGNDPNQACIINYTKNYASKTNVPTNDVPRQLNFATSSLGDWYSPYNSRICNPRTSVNVNNNSLSIRVPVVGTTTIYYKTTVINKTKIALSLNSSLQYKEMFNGLFYSDRSIHDWPHLKFSSSDLMWKPITTYSKMNFVHQGSVTYANMNTHPVPGTPPLHAQKTYDENKHTEHFTTGFSVQWKDSACPKKDSNSQLCKNQGKIFWFRVELYDARHDFIEDITPKAMWRTDQNGTGLHVESLRSFLPPGTQKNPFKIMGNIVTAQADVLPMIKNAILVFEEKSKVDGVDYVPPRKLIGGKYETNEEYFAHFGVSSIGFGWEMSGLAKGNFETYKFTLTGILK